MLVRDLIPFWSANFRQDTEEENSFCEQFSKSGKYPLKFAPGIIFKGATIAPLARAFKNQQCWLGIESLSGQPIFKHSEHRRSSHSSEQFSKSEK